MIEFIKKDNSKNLVLFVHGFIGGKETWMNNDKPSEFIEYLLQNEEIKSNYDFAIFNYFTKISDVFEDISWFVNLIRGKRKIKKNLSIEEISNLLSSQISIVLKDYNKITLISHSMGGLVSKAYILQDTKENESSKIKLYISLAVPHNGSNLASIGKIIVNNPQVEDLAPLGQSINNINSTWVKQEIAAKLPLTIYHQGSYDRVVPKESSAGYDSRNVEIVYSDDDHFSILKPENKDDVVVVSCISALINLLKNNNQNPASVTKENKGEATTQSSNNRTGDVFNDITDATIVNKSLVKDAFNDTNEKQDEGVVLVFSEIRKQVELSANVHAKQLFASFKEEWFKDSPSSIILKTIFNGLKEELPSLSENKIILENLKEILNSKN